MRTVVASLNIALQPTPHRFVVNNAGLGGGVVAPPAAGGSVLETQDGANVLETEDGRAIKLEQ